MSRAHIWQAAIVSALIMAAALALDILFNVVLFPNPEPYSPVSTIAITLFVAPPFTLFLIHQRASMQKAQAALAEERAARLAEVEAARDMAEAATLAKSQFLANMSHEIRTPLNGVLGMAQALESRNLDGESRDMVATIRDSGATLMAILNDVLDLSKIEAGRLDISPVAGDVTHTVRKVHKLFLPKADEKRISLVFREDEDSAPAPRLRYDPVRVRQCVSNLVSNAVKFTQEGRVEIQVSNEPAKDGRICVAVRISDTGVGMDRETLNRLFEAFTQADGSITRKFGGTGLGLAISRRLARLMGGDIVASSTPGIGSHFTFTFLADAVDPASEVSAPGKAGAASRVVRLREARLLLVDDNAINRQVARLFLQPQGAVLTEAANGREALDLLAAQPFDLVLLDVHMPVMDGKEAIARIRASSEPWSAIPVIALTADAMSGDREKLLGLGMSGYVSKPIEQNELLTEIGRVLGASVPGLAPVPREEAPETKESFDDLLGDLDKIANG